MGGGSVGATGQFNFSVEEAYLEWPPHKTPEGAILIGEAEEIMNKISMLQKTWHWQLFCGSISGSIYNSRSAPLRWILLL